MIAVDTDVLTIYHIFHKDSRYKATKQFFDKHSHQIKAVTIFNLLELCGILSSANRSEDSNTIFHKYLRAEDIKILFPKLTTQSEKEFWGILVSECFLRIQKGLSLRDAVILWTLESFK